jgi:tetratricopeptide (TPR) repeat protein
MTSVSALFDLASRHHQAGDLVQAMRFYREVLALDPHHADSVHRLGVLAHQRGQNDIAVGLIADAIALDDQVPAFHNNLGSVYRAQGRLADAVASYGRAVALRPDYAEAHSNLGNVLKDQGRLDEAITSYRQALAYRPDHADAHNNLGIALQEQGDLDAAYRAFEQAVALAPQSGRYYRTLTTSGRVGPSSPHTARMEQLARNMAALPDAEQMELHFALGRVHGDGGRHESSFRHLLAGNRLARRRIAYDEPATLARFDRIRARFTASQVATGARTGIASALPVFIVGMPRSGSSLLEQILASHSKVFGAGELLDLPQLAEALAPADGVAADPGLPPERLRQLGATYLDRLQAKAPSAARIVDKLPQNFELIGLIHLALPDARILHITRDPVDTCLSCFSKLFVGQQLPYSYDLAELGRYYRAYEGLMAHWREVLPPGVMLEIRYEALVADMAGEARRAVAHCGLDWDERCLDFHRTQRVVRTASAAQVRQPLYATSVGHWRAAFGALAHPLFDALGLSEASGPSPRDATRPDGHERSRGGEPPGNSAVSPP